MKLKVFLFALIILPVTVAMAQEGHPFKGTWRGEIDMSGEAKAVVIIMDYDGDNITGMIDPGRTSYRFDSAALDAANWKLTASAVNRDGIPVRLEGVLHEIGARNRYLEGTWRLGNTSYPFRITRE